MPATPGRGGVSAARSVPGAYLAGTPPAPPLGGCGGWGGGPAAVLGATRGRAACGAPGPSWGGEKGGGVSGHLFRGPACGLEGCLVSVWGERTVAGPKNLRTVAGGCLDLFYTAGHGSQRSGAETASESNSQVSTLENCP